MEGWYGQDCLKPCVANCRDNATCHHVTGYCDVGCPPGWIGDLCTKRNCCLLATSDLTSFLQYIENPPNLWHKMTRIFSLHPPVNLLEFWIVRLYNGRIISNQPYTLYECMTKLFFKSHVMFGFISIITLIYCFVIHF